MRAQAIILATVAGLATTPAMASEQDSHVSLGVTAGSLGVGPEVAVRIAPRIGLRANATFLSGIGHSVDGSQISYDGDLKLSSVGAMVDVHPFANGLRLSGGFRIDSNKIKLTGSPDATQTVNVGGTTYTGAELGTLTGAIKAKDFAPTLTLGYDGGLTRGIKFGVDAGVMFQGSPRIRNLTASGPIADDPDFQDALAQEQRDIEDDIDQYKLYPILQLSLRYAF